MTVRKKIKSELTYIKGRFVCFRGEKIRLEKILMTTVSCCAYGECIYTIELHKQALVIQERCDVPPIGIPDDILKCFGNIPSRLMSAFFNTCMSLADYRNNGQL